jgi:hypothetical protein
MPCRNSITGEFSLILEHCEINNKLQIWIFQNENKNPDIIENSPEISINDMEDWLIEEKHRSHHYNKFSNIWWTVKSQPRKMEYCMGFNQLKTLAINNSQLREMCNVPWCG